MMNAVLWDVTPCGYIISPRNGFGCWLLLTLFLAPDSYHPDFGGDTFFRNVGFYKSHIT
jgi:hypothetical protein